MYSAVNCFCIVLFSGVLIEGAPVISKHVSDVSLIISDSCMDQSNSRASPSDAMSNAIAAAMPRSSNDSKQLYLNEVSKLSQEIQKNHSDWLIHYTQFISPIKTIICVSPVRHCQLSVEKNTQFFVMTQLAIFANYFQSHERDDAYPVDFKEGLIKLKNTLYNAICLLKNVLLLNSVAMSDIDKYVTDDYTQGWLSVDNEKGAIKRAAVMAELNILSQFLESFTFNSTSIAMKNNFPTSNCG